MGKTSGSIYAFFGQILLYAAFGQGRSYVYRSWSNLLSICKIRAKFGRFICRFWSKVALYVQKVVKIWSKIALFYGVCLVKNLTIPQHICKSRSNSLYIRISVKIKDTRNNRVPIIIYYMQFSVKFNPLRCRHQYNQRFPPEI